MNRRALGALAAGHAAADLCQGAVPALVPFLVHDRGLSYTQTGVLLLVMSITSSVLQPAIGAWADRRRPAWSAPVGVLLGGGGIAALGFATSFPAMAATTGVAGCGVALFHPEAARRATQAAGERGAGGLGLFALGGSTGFALAPVLLTPSVAIAGLEGTVVALAPALIAAALLLRLPAPAEAAGDRAATAGRDQPRAFAVLAVVGSLRAGVYFAVQSFLAAALVARLGVAVSVGNAALTVLLVAAAAGTLAGGLLADRLGERTVIGASLAACVPALALVQLAPDAPLAIAASALLGATVSASYSATVVLGQRLLPSRASLAAGTTLGLAMGVGGLVVAALGPLADAAGPEAALWAVVALPVAGALLARALPGARRLTLRPATYPARG
jgi:MFS transporter, FSR family, fosmidomycin resistance protein